MLEQRDDIGKALVERRDVEVRGLLEATMHAVKQCMRRLMRDDVA